MSSANAPSNALWRADQLVCTAGADAAHTGTGFDRLDAELPGGGWPAAGLIEFLMPTFGGGAEWPLLGAAFASSVAAASATLNGDLAVVQQRSIVCVTPPHDPYAPGLAKLGLEPGRLIKVSAASLADASWSAEQSLKAKSCAAVVWWVSANIQNNPLNMAMRRLNLAAQEGETPIFIVRDLAAQNQASPAPLRLRLEPVAPGQLAVTVFKRRGLPMAKPIILSISILDNKAFTRWQALTCKKQKAPQNQLKSASVLKEETSQALILEPMVEPMGPGLFNSQSQEGPTSRNKAEAGRALKKGQQDVVVCTAPARLAA